MVRAKGELPRAVRGAGPAPALRPNGWEAFRYADVVLMLLAAAVLVAVALTWRGVQLAAAGGVIAAAVAVAAVLVAREHPSVPEDLCVMAPCRNPASLHPTAVPWVTLACFVVAAASLAAFAFASRR